MPPHAHVVFDDGKGAAAIGLSLNRVEPGSEQARQVTTCPDKAFVDHDGCTSTRLPDGSRLMLFRGCEYPDRRVDTKRWTAELVTPKGLHVSLSEWNAPAEKDAPVVASPAAAVRGADEGRSSPPACGGGSWTPCRQGPKPSRSAAPRTGRARGLRELGRRHAGLAAARRAHRRQARRAGSDYAFLVVDDGQGGSLVQINVQSGMSDVAGQLFGDGEKLPDGTRVATRQAPGEKGGSGVVMWTVDTLRPGPEGCRVVVSAFNTPAQNEDATRDAPALTVAQLREIALSAEWDTLR
ncbi:putative protein OS=Streptomyces tendae OX=1932 GN=F3L20_04695 PE=4 SV=1 [Streptomyces tendae]